MKNKKRTKLNKRAIISKLVILVSIFVITFGLILLSSDSIFLNVSAEANYSVKTENYKGNQVHIIDSKVANNPASESYGCEDFPG